MGSLTSPFPGQNRHKHMTLRYLVEQQGFIIRYLLCVAPALSILCITEDAVSTRSRSPDPLSPFSITVMVQGGPDATLNVLSSL